MRINMNFFGLFSNIYYVVVGCLVCSFAYLTVMLYCYNSTKSYTELVASFYRNNGSILKHVQNHSKMSKYINNCQNMDGYNADMLQLITYRWIILTNGTLYNTKSTGNKKAFPLRTDLIWNILKLDLTGNVETSCMRYYL